MVRKLRFDSLEKKRYRYYLLAGVVVLIIIGIFHVQIRSISTFLFGVTVDRAIDLAAPDEQNFSMLILGIGGGTHDGPNLTDTIIYAHVDIEKKRADLISIPRDLWISDAQTKINALYAFGKEDGTGKEDVKQAVEEIVGETIDYVVVIDFQGFVNLVDHLGGIEVDVEREFYDYAYPISGKETDPCGYSEEQIIDLSFQITTGSATESEAFPCRYETLYFEKGKQTMDGQTALRYVRSRHGTNGEGSDFARSRRQQKIIDAVRGKMLSLGVLLNPVKVVGIYNIVKGNIDTTIDTEKLDDFVKLGQNLQDGTIRSFVVEEEDVYGGKPGLLTSPPRTSEYLYQYVLVPRAGTADYSEIQSFVRCVSQGNECVVTETSVGTPSPTVTPPSSTSEAGR